MAENLNRAIDSLPSSCRTVFELRVVHEFSTKEAAMALNISVAAVKAKVLRSRRYIEKRLTAPQGLNRCRLPASSRLGIAFSGLN
jgi:RNA polymerase sigma-70 factor, ECF subfamily